MASLSPNCLKKPVRIVCLSGFMGSGKTTVGRLLAQSVGWHFVDLDQRIVESAGMGIPEIFSRLGEASFREIEGEQLYRALDEASAGSRNLVLSLGGGTTTRTSNLEALATSGCALIWLRCPVDELLRRCAQITDRPLFRDEASFRELHAQRLPFYELASYSVDSVGEPRHVVEQILALEVLDRKI